MTAFLLTIIFIVSALSLLSYIYCWNEIKSGRPHIIAVRQVTSIMDRNRLNEWLGAPLPGFYYALTPQQVQEICRRRAAFVYGECAADIACLFGAWWFSNSTASEAWIYGFIALAGLCQAINLGYSFWLMQKWQHQIREEIENSED